jgi:cell division septum initiation protein DivIVA
MLDRRDSVSEIDQLLDRLESYAESSPWYLPNKIVIKDDEFFKITQRIREMLPQELAEAKRVLERRDLILKNAQEEHKRIIETAEKRLEDMTQEHHISVEAQHWAERHVDKARQEAKSVKREALQYTVDLLADMEKQFNTTLTTLQKGRAYLEEEINDELAQAAAAVEPDTPQNPPSTG